MRACSADSMCARAACSAASASCFLIALAMVRCWFQAVAARPRISYVVDFNKDSESPSAFNAFSRYLLWAAPYRA